MKPLIPPSETLLLIDDLDRTVVRRCARINAETYELLVMIRQFDERAAWLHHRCDP